MSTTIPNFKNRDASKTTPKSELNESNELSENNKSSVSSESSEFFCLTCDAGPFSIDAETKGSGKILDLHKNKNHTISYRK